jgi:hypothetical protein
MKIRKNLHSALHVAPAGFHKRISLAPPRLFKRIRVLVLVGCSLASFLIHTLLAQQTVASALDRLREKDQLQLLMPIPAVRPQVAGFKVSFVMRIKHIFAADQGQHLSSCDVVWTRNWVAMKIADTYEQNPVFRPPGTTGYQPLDYDAQGNLNLWRPIARYVLSTRDTNETYDVSAMYTLGPDGRAVATNTYTKVSRFPVGDRNNLYIFDQFRMATGWGFGSLLTRITATTPAPSHTGCNLIEAVGSYGKGLSGKWVIICEAGDDPLIREAQFLVDGSGEPLVSVSDSGVLTAPGLRIALSGSFRSGRYESNFQVLNAESLDASSINRDPLFKEISARLAAQLPAESETLDFRGKKPERVFKEPGVNKDSGQ